jgi:hypothetical protein
MDSVVLAVTLTLTAEVSFHACQTAGLDEASIAARATDSVSVDANASNPDRRACYALTAPRARGDLIAARDLSPASCTPAVTSQPIRFDGVRRALVATEAMSPGARIGPLHIDHIPTQTTGDEMSATFQIGAVTVERSLRLLEAAPSQGTVMVRSADGEVFPVDVQSLSRMEHAK